MASTAGDIGASKEDVVAPTSVVKVEDKTAKVEDEADVPDPDEDDLDDLDGMSTLFIISLIHGTRPTNRLMT